MNKQEAYNILIEFCRAENKSEQPVLEYLNETTNYKQFNRKDLVKDFQRWRDPHIFSR